MPLRGADSSNYEGGARYTSKMYIIIKGVKRGDADDEGIYLLAKDLAYNVALDQTSQLTEGIKQLQQKELHEVSRAIISLDTSINGKGKEEGIDAKICKNGAYANVDNTNNKIETKDKCGVGGSTDAQSGNTTAGLSRLWIGNAASQNGGGNYTEGDTSNVGPRTSAKISKDMSELTRGEKGVVSSAFAKAHEGAEIVDSLRESMERFVSLVKCETAGSASGGTIGMHRKYLAGRTMPKTHTR